MKVLGALLLAGLVTLIGCSGASSGSSSSSTAAAAVGGNWQIALQPSDQVNFQPRTLSGFLQQTGSNLTGSVQFLIPNTQNPSAPPCAGAASVSGMVTGQSLKLLVNQNGQMLTLSGTTSSANTPMSGTYTSPDGACEPSESGTWTATLIQPIAGTFQGVFHSVSTSSYSLQNKDFQVIGTLMQSANAGASSATLTGFITAVDYRCFDSAALNGIISGDTVRLNIIGSSGLQIGEMGAAVGSQSPGGATVSTNGLALFGSNASGTGYFIANTKACPFLNSSFDYGNFCLNFGSTTTCTDPLNATPNNITFPTLFVGDNTGLPAMVTVTNQTSGATAQPIQVTASIVGLTSSDSPADFSIVSQTCDSTQPPPPPQGPLQMTIASQATCTLGIKFVPTGSCPLDPTVVPPAKCPQPRTAQLELMDTLDPTVDPNNPHAVSLVGIGNTAVVPSMGELDFGFQDIGTVSPPKTITFTNQGNAPVTILPATTTVDPTTGLVGCAYPTTSITPPGLQVVGGPQAGNGVSNFVCDNNFTISTDGCSGTTLPPEGTCTVSISFTPQPAIALDDFLQINSSESDTSRFPVELKGNQTIITPAAAARKRKR